MPIGYIVGKQYRINTEYDQWAKLDVFSKIVRLAMQRGLSLHTSYSHIGRNYGAEVKTLHQYKENGPWFTISVALKNDATPLLAIVAALKAAFEKHPECDDILMRVLFMEAEAAELKLAIGKAREREKKQAALEARLDSQLDALYEVLALAWGYQTRAEMKLLIANPLIQIAGKTNPLVYQPGDTPEDEEWRRTMARDPGSDEDDYL